MIQGAAQEIHTKFGLSYVFVLQAQELLELISLVLSQVMQEVISASEQLKQVLWHASQKLSTVLV